MRRRGGRERLQHLFILSIPAAKAYTHTHARGATTISATLARIVHSLPSSHRIRPRGGGDRVSSSLYYLVLPAGSLPPTPPPPPLFNMQMRHLSSPLSRARFIYHFFPPPLPSSIFFFIFFPLRIPGVVVVAVLLVRAIDPPSSPSACMISMYIRSASLSFFLPFHPSVVRE